MHVDDVSEASQFMEHAVRAPAFEVRLESKEKQHRDADYRDNVEHGGD